MYLCVLYMRVFGHFLANRRKNCDTCRSEGGLQQHSIQVHRYLYTISMYSMNQCAFNIRIRVCARVLVQELIKLNICLFGKFI